MVHLRIRLLRHSPLIPIPNPRIKLPRFFRFSQALQAATFRIKAKYLGLENAHARLTDSVVQWGCRCPHI